MLAQLSTPCMSRATSIDHTPNTPTLNELRQSIVQVCCSILLPQPASMQDSLLCNRLPGAAALPHRLQVGSMDKQKAVPAIGILKAPSCMHSDCSPERSGRLLPTSTVAITQQTIQLCVKSLHGSPSLHMYSMCSQAHVSQTSIYKTIEEELPCHCRP